MILWVGLATDSGRAFGAAFHLFKRLWLIEICTEVDAPLADIANIVGINRMSHAWLVHSIGHAVTSINKHSFPTCLLVHLATGETVADVIECRVG